MGVSYECNVSQGFEFQNLTTYGYVTELVIGTTTLAADISAGETPAPRAAVLVNLSWVGPTEPITFAARFSAANLATLVTLQETSGATEMVIAQFVVHEYDQINRAWFQAFKTISASLPAGFTTTAKLSGSICGQLQDSGPGGSSIVIDKTPLTSATGIENYQVRFRLTPVGAPAPQEITIAASVVKSVTESWGVPV